MAKENKKESGYDWHYPELKEKYFAELQQRALNAQIAAIGRILQKNPELRKRFIELWKQIDYNSYILTRDPEFQTWLEEE